jgi:hypothetical protein
LLVIRIRPDNGNAAGVVDKVAGIQLIAAIRYAVGDYMYSIKHSRAGLGERRVRRPKATGSFKRVEVRWPPMVPAGQYSPAYRKAFYHAKGVFQVGDIFESEYPWGHIGVFWQLQFQRMTAGQVWKPRNGVVIALALAVVGGHLYSLLQT